MPESEGPVEFAIVLDREWGIDARYEVEVLLDQLTATPGIARLGKKGDFEDPGVLVVRIPAGQTRFEFSIPLYDDDVREEDETFQLLLGSSIDKSFRTIGPSNTALATIADDDRIPPTEVELSLSHRRQGPGIGTRGLQPAEITVTASFPQVHWPGDAANAPLHPADPLDVDTTVRVQVDPNSGATHAAGLDDFEPLRMEDDLGEFQVVESFDIVIPAGQTSGNATVGFWPVKDDVDEEDETVTLQGSEVVGGGSQDSLPVRSASFTIIDDDTRGITVSPANTLLFLSLVEGGEPGTYSLVLDSQPTDTVVITLAGNQGGFLRLVPDTLTFTTSDWVTPQTVSVMAMDDGITGGVPPTNFITHQVSGGDYGSVMVPDISTLIEDTTKAFVYLEGGQASESDGYVEFTVSVRPILRTTPVLVRYATVNGTAIAGSDYTREVESGQTYKILNIPAGQSSGIIRIPITNDQVYESADETFTLQLTNHNNKATLDGSTTSLTATGAIADDDPKPVVSVAGPAGEVSYVSENAKDPVTFTLTLVGQSAGDVTVDYATGEAGLLDLFTARQGLAGATEDEDYAGTSGTVTFTSGQTTKTVTVQVTNDDVSEDTEFFGFRISAPQGADLRGQRSEDVADVGLLDDDQRGVTIGPASIGLDEPVAGGTAVAGAYTVKLSSSPTDTVTVTIGGGDPAVSLSGDTLTNNQLTFTTTNWNMAQTITVTPVKDDNAVGETVTLTHTVSGGDYAGIAADSVTVNLTDSDARNLVLSEESLAVTEGDATGVGYTVKLATQPSDTVTVTISGHDGADLTLSGTTLTNNQLTFTTTNWGTAQTVTVKPGDDDNDDNESETLAHTASGGDYVNITKDLPVSITDDDEAAIVLSETDLTVTEGDAAGSSYTVKLATEPPGSVSVSITGQAGTDLTLDKTTLTFTVDNWNTAQTVTVEAGHDDDGANDTATLTHRASGGDYASITANLPVTVTDDDTAGVTIEPTALSVVAGRSNEYTIKLATRPSGEVTVTVSGHAGTHLTLDKTTLTFTLDNWDTAQTVTVSATQNAATAKVTLVHAVAGADYGSVTAEPVVVSVVAVAGQQPTLQVGVSSSAQTLTVPEGGANSYTLVLGSRPTGDVTVGVTLPTGSDLSLDKTTLTFSSTNWDVAQTVAVTAAEDDDAVTDAGVTLTHTVSGGGYNSTTVPDVEVSITENDTAGIVISKDSLTVGEGDPAGSSYTVRLATRPSDSVSVAITGHAGTDLSLDKTTLIFTADNWNTAQTVTVKAGQDHDAANDTAALTHTASGGDYANLTVGLPVTVTDTDTAGVTIKPTALSVVAGRSNEYTIKLATRPSGSVSVAITGQASTNLSLDNTTLTFTVDNWDTAQTVTVSATQNAATAKVTLAHAVAGADYASVTAESVVVSVVDRAGQQPTLQVGVTSSAQTLTVPEGSADSYTLVLGSRPTGDVTVGVTLPAGTDLTLDKTSLTFTSTNWDVAQAVTVTAAEDDDAVTDAGVTLTHTVSGGGYTSTTVPDVEVSITENDTAGIVISKDSLTVGEGVAAESSYTVKLATQPTGEVTVTVSGHAGTDLSLSGTTLSSNMLTFTVDNWDDAQTVTVKAGQDHDAANDTASLTHTASGGDYASVSNTLPVTVADNDQAAVVLSETDLTVVEGDAAGSSYTVKLATEPTGSVSVSITGQAGTDLTLDKTTLTFTVDNWNTAQTVTVEAGHDDDGTMDAATLTHRASGGDYASVSNTLPVTVTDDDEAAIVLSETDLTVTEGDAAGSSYTVRLATRPSGSVSVAITGHAGTDLSLDNTTLTFTVDNWDTAQTVTVKAGEDHDAANDTAALTHTASGGDYANLTVGLPVTVTDDDTPGVTIEPTALSVVAGRSNEYTVRLATEPTGDVTVTVSGHAGTDLSLDKTTLTFTVDNWDTAQTVTVSATQNAATAKVTLAHAVAGADYGSVTAEPVVISVVGRAGQQPTLQVGVSSSAQTLTIPEGGANSYTLVLGSRPTGDVTVGVTLPTGTDLTLDKTSLTFTSTNWDVAQTVAVTAAEDDDAVTDAGVTLTHTVSGGGYNSTSVPDVEVSITENDTAGIVISKDSLTVGEGDPAGSSYTVKLATQPSGEVTVTISGQAGTDLTLDKTTLTFTVDNWDTAQTVTVTAGEDDDGANDTASLTHTASGGDYASITVALPVTVTDDDTPALVLSKTGLTVTEEDAAGSTYTVRLATQPSGSVSVAITGQASTDLTLDKTTLTFTADNWATAQTVTVKAGHDDDDVNDTASLTHTASGGDYANLTVGLSVNIIDDDTPPTAANGTVTTNEDTDHTFLAANFSYSDTDSDPLASVKIIELPAAGTGALTLNGKAITSADLPKTVTATELTENKLTYSPPTNANGTGYASFKFKVNDGTADSASEYFMTINVTAVNDPATGTPTISGTAQVGQILTASTGDIADPDGVPSAFTYQWKRYAADRITFEANIGTDLMTYTLTASEEGKKVLVEVSFTDNGGSSEGPLVSALYPSTQSQTVDPNNPPTASDGTVTTVEDTDHTFAAANFNYSDTDSDPLASVKIIELPAAGTGALTLNGTAITSADLPKTVTATELTGGGLKYAPPANANGTGYASFKFKVNDGTEDSASEYFMTINVTAVNDPATGAPIISGTAHVGLTLTASTAGIDDVDGLPSAFTYQWKRVDADGTSNPTDIGADSSAYTLTAAEEGKKVLVEVSFTDNGGSSEGPLSSAAYPSSGTVVNLTVSFGETTYMVTENGAISVIVHLSADPERTVAIPITATPQDSASSADYTVPTSVTFNAGDMSKTITFTATQDAEDDDGESVLLAFGILPDGVSPGTRNETTVSITDDDVPQVTVSFGQAAYTVAEGGMQSVTVTLSADPERTVVVPLTATPQDGADSPADYTLPPSVTFDAGETEKTITFTAAQDEVDDDGESVLLAFGAPLPGGVSLGTTVTTTVSITDDDVAGVSVSKASLTIAEGSSGTYTIVLDSQPIASVAVAINDPSNTDVTAEPASLTFSSTDWNTPKTVTVNAAQDADAEDETVTVTHTVTSTDSIYSGASANSVAVSVTDDEVPVTVQFGATTYEVVEGESVTVAVTLSADPERTVVIPITHTPQGNTTSTDYSGVPANVTFSTGDMSQTITFTATQDDVDDGGKSVLLAFGAPLPGGVSLGTTVTTTVSITDDDVAGVSVSKASLTIAEGSFGTYTIVLDSQPIASVAVAINDPSNTDVTAEPASLTFSSTDWNTPKTVTVNAAQDADAEDETVTVTHTVTSTDSIYSGASANSVAVSVITTTRCR